MDVRSEAAIALAKVGSHSAKAVPPLIEVLQHGSDHDKYLAARSLGLIGDGAQDAIPYLARELTGSHVDVRRAAQTALQKIGTPEALQAVEQTGQ
jgi:HEAT repeat protein